MPFQGNAGVTLTDTQIALTPSSLYAEAPDEFEPYPKGLITIFLAGGITNCPDWQYPVANVLVAKGYRVLNPRRANFPIDNPDAAEEQIQWEYQALSESDAILFWFPAGSIQPIALFELGRWSMQNKPIAVGCDINYERKQDVEIQMGLCYTEVAGTINDTVLNLEKEIMRYT